MHFTRSLIAAGVGLLCAAAPAGADSIAYIKDNNIWLAHPDGSGQVQVTHDGTSIAPYRSPSQADDGKIAAAHGGDLVTLAQTGQPLAEFAPPTATDSTGQLVQDVPQQVAISPDGHMIAYVYSQPSCPPGAPCGVRQVMLYSAADHTTPVAAYGEQTNLTNPTWIDNNRVLAFGGHFHQVNIDSPGGGNDDARYWFDDPGNEDIGDGELSRQGDRLALVRSYGPGTHIAVFHVNGSVGGATPVPACLTGTDPSLAGPSWSPDATKLAFADSQGIEVMPIPSVLDGDCPGAASSTIVVPGRQCARLGPRRHPRQRRHLDAGARRPAAPCRPPPRRPAGADVNPEAHTVDDPQDSTRHCGPHRPYHPRACIDQRSPRGDCHAPAPHARPRRRHHQQPPHSDPPALSHPQHAALAAPITHDHGERYGHAHPYDGQPHHPHAHNPGYPLSTSAARASASAASSRQRRDVLHIRCPAIWDIGRPTGTDARELAGGLSG